MLQGINIPLTGIDPSICCCKAPSGCGRSALFFVPFPLRVPAEPGGEALRKDVCENEKIKSESDTGKEWRDVLKA